MAMQSIKAVNYSSAFEADKNHTGIDDRCVSSWFCSHPAGPYPREQERTMAPYQDRPLLHLTFAQ